ncbi:hypothetical protein D3C78_1122040 [compost metagenome]
MIIGYPDVQLERQLVFQGSISMIERPLEGQIIRPVTLAAAIRRGESDLDHFLVITTMPCAGIANQRLAGAIPVPLNCGTAGGQPGGPAQGDI